MSFFHGFPLIVDVQRKRAGNSFATHQFRTTGDDKAEAGHTLNTFIGAADQKINSQIVYIHRNAAKAAHAVNNQFFAMHLDDVSQFLDRVQNAGSRFTMHEGNMSHIRVVAQIVIDILYRHLFRFFESQHIIVEMIIFGNVSHAVSVCSVAANQEFIFGSDRCTEYSFHAVSAAALQEDRGVIFCLCGGKRDKFFAKFLYNAEVVVLIPCTPVGHHGFFYSG